MRKIRALIVTALVAGAATAAPAIAQEHNGYAEIVRGDYPAAERSLVSSRRTFPEHADLTLNLATVYWHNGRVSDARALYRDVLARPDEKLALPAKRTASSHALARLALSRLDGSQLSAR